MQVPREPLDLKAIAADRFRIAYDESAKVDRSQESKNWCIQIPCKHGHVGVHSDRELSAFCRSTRLFGRLTSIPTARVIQEGDKEIRIAFHPEHLDDVAELLKGRRKRVVTEATRAKLAPTWFKPTAPTTA
jgi:hypothetical protein